MKFYYLREFKKEEGFNNLTIMERMILSALVTSKINNDDRDLVEIIMNYDNNIFYTSYTNWQNYKDFSFAISDFLKNAKGHISDYIIENFDKVDDKGNRVLHYVSFDYDDLEIHHKNSMMSIACKAFILGCANHAVHDNNDWFSFNVCQWSKIAMNQRKRTLQEIDDYMKRHNIFYTLSGNKITIDNKRKQVLQTIAAEEKEKTAKVKLPKTKTPAEPIVEETEETIPEEETVEEVNVNELIDDIPFSNIDPDEILDLGEDKRFNFDIFKKLYEYEQDNYQYCTKEYDKIKAQLNGKAPELLRKMLKQYNLDINNYLSKYENLSKVYHEEKLGDNWKEIKDNARLEFDTVKANISRGLDNLFDKNFTAYKFIVYYIATKNKQFVTLNI